VTTPGPVQQFDTWDGMRARSWDLFGVSTLPELLGALGGAGLPPGQQRVLLQEFRDSPVWIPAPGNIKDAVSQALGEARA
jgi:hypothetical protein